MFMTKQMHFCFVLLFCYSVVFLNLVMRCLILSRRPKYLQVSNCSNSSIVKFFVHNEHFCPFTLSVDFHYKNQALS